MSKIKLLLASKGLTKEQKSLIHNIESSFKGETKTGKVKKTGFSASTLFYGPGQCFSADTEFVTDEGIKKLGDCVGKQVTVWTGGTNGRSKNWQGHGWKPATVESFGVQRIVELVLIRNGVEKVINTTENHRWLIVTPSRYADKTKRHNPEVCETRDLSPGDVIWNGAGVRNKRSLSIDGIRHGFVFGDGNKPGDSTTAQFFGDKDAAMIGYFSDYRLTDPHEHPEGNHVLVRRAYGLPGHYKDEPRPEFGKHYLYGFLAGLFAADGNIHDSGSASISSSKIENIKMIQNICEILRIGYGSMSSNYRKGINGEFSYIYNISLSLRDLSEEFFLMDHHKEYFRKMIEGKKEISRRSWRVKEVRRTDRYEEVFCVVEPETESFALPDGILTKNCPRRWSLLFRGVEDSYEEWPYFNRRAVHAGSGAHDFLQEVILAQNPNAIIEQEFNITEPTMRGFIDVYFPDENVPMEIKTCNKRTFEIRQDKMEPADYQLRQLLVYMKIKNADLGLMMYECREDFSFLLIPIVMTDERRQYIDRVFDWMREVEKTKEGGIAKVFPGKRSNSRICSDCSVRAACEAAEEGVVELPLLSKYAEGQ